MKLLKKKWIHDLCWVLIVLFVCCTFSWMILECLTSPEGMK